jgi:glycosyltransferase involved in cell wall biosynthesis
MLGFVENVLPYIKNASVLVLTSDYEGLPTILIEALACGTQIVSTDCPHGPAEILDYGRYGQLIPTGDLEALKRAINNALNKNYIVSSDLLRERAEVFSIEKTFSQYMQLITQCHY